MEVGGKRHKSCPLGLEGHPGGEPAVACSETLKEKARMGVTRKENTTYYYIIYCSQGHQRCRMLLWEPVPRDAHQRTEPLVTDLVLPLMKHWLLQLQGRLSADRLQLSIPSGITPAKSHLTQGHILPEVAYI